MVIVDSLFRLARQENQLDNLGASKGATLISAQRTKHSRQCWERRYRGYTHSAEMEKTLQSNQKYRWFSIRQDRFLDICTVCRQTTIKGS